MGVILTPIIPRRVIKLRDLRFRKLAVDALGELYQFLSLIRLPTGEPLRAPDGSITSHLVGLAFRVTRLMEEYEMDFIFVFDGPPHPLKLKELEKRRKLREKAFKEWKEALAKGDYEKAFSKAVVALKLDRKSIEDAKKLLTLMGVPWVQAKHDAEAEAAHLVRKKLAWAVVSKDYDSLLYGAPRLVRFLTISGTEFLPSKGIIKPLQPELIELQQVLSQLKITHEQLVDIAILVGTDFNEGVKGIGPKKALQLIRKYGSIENLPIHIKRELEDDYKNVRNLFLSPPVNEELVVHKGSFNEHALMEFLSKEKGFSEKRVRILINRLKKIYGKRGRQRSLEKWFRSGEDL